MEELFCNAVFNKFRQKRGGERHRRTLNDKRADFVDVYAFFRFSAKNHKVYLHRELTITVRKPISHRFYSFGKSRRGFPDNFEIYECNIFIE